MITLYRIDHVSQVVENLAEQAALLEGLMGFRPVREWESDEEGCRGMMLELPGSRNQRWELLEPAGERSVLQDFLDSPLGPGLHHLAVETNDMESALAEIDELGLTGRARRPSGGSWIDVPIAPPEPDAGSTGGLLLRLFGAPAAQICGDDRGRSEAAPTGGDRNEGANAAARGATGDLGIRELVHICQATSDLDVLAAWNGRMLGMRPIYRTPQGKHPDMATMMLAVPGTQIIWEMIAPAGQDSFIERFVKKRGEASCHHVTFEVEDWDRAVEACERHGLPIFGESAGETDGARWRDAFIHPKHTAGVLVQIYFEERPGVWMRSDKIAAARARDSAWS